MSVIMLDRGVSVVRQTSCEPIIMKQTFDDRKKKMWSSRFGSATTVFGRGTTAC